MNVNSKHNTTTHPVGLEGRRVKIASSKMGAEWTISKMGAEERMGVNNKLKDGSRVDYLKDGSRGKDGCKQ